MVNAPDCVPFPNRAASLANVMPLGRFSKTMAKKSKIPVSFEGRSLTISCTNRQRSENFYVGVLGAVPIPGDGHGCRWYRLGSLTISLMPNAELPAASTFPDHAMPVLWLDVNDIQQAHRHLKKASATIIQAPDDDVLMLIADPDGLIIEIWQKDGDAA